MQKKENNKFLSIIIPIDLYRRPNELLARLENIIDSCGCYNHEIIIGHNDRGLDWDQKLKNLIEIKKEKPVILVSEKNNNDYCNNSRLRNIATNISKGAYIIFMDVDIYPDYFLFDKMARKVASGELKFSMLPCFYLNKTGSQLLAQKKDANKEIIKSFFSYSRKYVQHLAMPTSLMVIRRSDLNTVGEFDEAYFGHGYEDFDLMLRIASHHNIGNPGISIMVDRPYKAPLLAEGFRAYLGEFCIDSILDEEYAFHFFHKKLKTDAYYERRTDNSIIFQKKMSAFLSKNKTFLSNVKPQSLIDVFFKSCRAKNVNPEKYFALFDSRPSHMHRIDGLVNKIKYVSGIFK